MIDTRIVIFICLCCFVTACHYEETREQTFSVPDICSCFESDTELNPDKRITNCAKPFKQFAQNLLDLDYKVSDVQELTNMGLSKSNLLLSKSCQSFRSEYLKYFEKELLINKGSTANNIINHYRSNPNTADKLQYAKALTTLGKYKMAIAIIDVHIGPDNDNDIAYWLKTYCHYKDDKLKSAIETIDLALKHTKSARMESIFENYRYLISPIMPLEEELITLSITKNEL